MKSSLVVLLIALAGCTHFDNKENCKSRATEGDRALCYREYGLDETGLPFSYVDTSEPARPDCSLLPAQGQRQRCLQEEEDRAAMNGLTDVNRDFCLKHVKSSEFKTLKDCRKAVDNPREYLCPHTLAAASQAKCLWNLDHPIEVACERDNHGDYWSCVRFGYERVEQQQALQLQKEGVEYQRQSAESQRRQADETQGVRNDAAQARMFEAIGNSFNRTTCVSTSDHMGGMTTVCH